ncbi:MAG: nickel-dependent hydrogenase large subunit [bacterium]
MHKITIDPITRIEGHLKIEAEVDNNVVRDAKSSSVLFRGFEVILQNRFPPDAVYITQRICGVCPVAHAIASVKCLENAFGVKPPKNGRILRNFIQAANHIESHILHFYHLAGLDFIKGPSVSPFIPRYEGKDFYRLDEKTNNAVVQQYLTALEVKAKSQELLAIWGGKMPHTASIIPGGVSETVTLDKIISSKFQLREISDFIENVYLPSVYLIADVYQDYFKIGIGPKNFLSYGVFDLLKQGVYLEEKDLPFQEDLIAEDISHSWYKEDSSRNPKKGKTEPDLHKKDAYSFSKSPRYNEKVFEVGPLARIWINNPALSEHGKAFLKKLNLKGTNFRHFGNYAFSVMGRHIARAEECLMIAKAMPKWLDELEIGKPSAASYNVPKEGAGMGLTEAPRGALGHWIEIKNSKISNYQCVVPTTWNASPKDSKGISGAIEQALIGASVSDHKNPIELARIVRSFDPCIACAVHVLHGKSKDIQSFRVI